MKTAITPLLVGTLELDTDKGFSGRVTTDDSSRQSFQLNIFEDVTSDPGLLAGVAPVVDDFHTVSDRARSALGKLLAAQDESVLEFVRFHLEEIDDLDERLRETLDTFLSGDGLPGPVAESFLIDGLVFHKGSEGDLEFWIDFALAPEYSDEVLCLRFDSSRTPGTISWES
ncbi:hypothetical protein ACFCV8_23515 [Streptomyces sp. NPDC056347]|uniref:hypothetical protein n=1 Tax=Streptomyces sp. NPDC056347 TaxID=3345790 RepID=UPI0035DB3A76